ncbi:hypothetical protein ES703_09327 [subsurface metagenome]
MLQQLLVNGIIAGGIYALVALYIRLYPGNIGRID